MKLISFLFSLFIVVALQISIFSQELKPSEILKQSQANLVLVCRIKYYESTYHKYPSEYIDETIATFRVLRVLKGEYKEKIIEVSFPDHLYFPENSNSIIFITDDMKTIAGNRKLGNCQKEPCFYSLSNWTLSNSKKNLSKIDELFKTQK